MTHLQAGDPAPWFSARTPGNDAYRFDTVAGRYIVLCFFGSAGAPEVQRLLSRVLGETDLFDDDRASFFGVSVDPQDAALPRVSPRIPGFRVFWDFNHAVSRRYGVITPPSGGAGVARFQPCSLVLDPGLRVVEVLPLGEPDAHADRLFALLRTLPEPQPHRRTGSQAPVLLIPRAFDAATCRTLIAYYRRRGGEDSGYMVQRDGKTVGVVNHAHKRRRDCTIEDAGLRDHCRTLVERRIVPELRKAYQFGVTRMERYIVACYDADEGGHFRAHRDNTTAGTAHRRFAMSIVLNDDFDGGEVWFPEYGRHLFKGPAGSALVFSCSILHEVKPVTAGERFTFLPFLYDEAAARVREQNNPFLDESIDRYRMSLDDSGAA